jgi:hypothetical protein
MDSVYNFGYKDYSKDNNNIKSYLNKILTDGTENIYKDMFTENTGNNLADFLEEKIVEFKTNYDLKETIKILRYIGDKNISTYLSKNPGFLTMRLSDFYKLQENNSWSGFFKFGNINTINSEIKYLR